MQEERPLIVSVNLTTACNLACTYCEAIHRRERIGLDDLDHLANGVGALDEPVQLVPFGGEPQVAWKALEHLIEGGEANGVHDFLMCTNGLLTNESRVDYFNQHHIEITVSWDGVPEAGDKLRIYPDGRGASADVEPIFELLRERYRLRPQVRITVGPDTAAYFARSVEHVLSFLAEKPGVKICFTPVSTVPWPEASLRAMEEALNYCADLLVEHERKGHDVSLAYNECIGVHEIGQQFLFADPEHGHACLWGIKMLGVDTDGGIFPCHTVIELRKESRAHLSMGNVKDGVPDLRRRLELMPPPEGNPFHCCYAWNLAGSGDPFKVPEVYRRIYAACITASERMVRALSPDRAEEAAGRAGMLLERTARWERDLSARTRPSPGRLESEAS
ncbi:MAG: hypothetical protein KC766_31935 [Myxococcales bacterium]|nr:hypothetical protein [Myxococcales bacterium]